jgi:RHS repeat-associated protein
MGGRRGITAPLYGKGEAVGMNWYDTGGYGGGKVYLGKDILGSVWGVTDEYGVVKERYEYDAFGEAYEGDLRGGMNLGYTGKPYDAAAGMYNYGYRDYKAELGRFTTEDPVRDGANWFAYVDNDPVNWIDLWGLSASDSTITVTGLGSGIGVDISIGAGPVESIAAEYINVTFSIAETDQLFTANYVNMVESRGGISVSANLHYVSSESKKSFPVGTSPETIARDYAGTSEYVSVSVGPFSISSSEQNGWSTYSVSVGPGIGFTLATGEVVTTIFIEGSLDIKR